MLRHEATMFGVFDSCPETYERRKQQVSQGPNLEQSARVSQSPPPELTESSRAYRDHGAKKSWLLATGYVKMTASISDYLPLFGRSVVKSFLGKEVRSCTVEHVLVLRWLSCWW